MTTMDDDENTNKNEEMKIIMPPAPKKEKERGGNRSKQISKRKITFHTLSCVVLYDDDLP